MAINFPDSPSNGDTFTANGKTFVYNSTNTSWRPQTAAESGGTDVLADMAALIAKTGMSNGDQALVQSTNNLYMYSGSGWYKIATIQNDAPSAITGVDGSYALATDGAATTITAVSTDPEGFALTWSYTSSGLGSIATVSQVDNVFTVTPSTDTANAGSFTLTISATDGINGAVSTVPSFTLAFIVQNSRYTSLSVKATNTGSNQTFDDASTSNYTITANGDVTASTLSPYRHGGYSLKFENSASDDNNIKFNNISGAGQVETAGEFCVETWVKFTVATPAAGSANPRIFASDGSGGNASWNLQIFPVYGNNFAGAISLYTNTYVYQSDGVASASEIINDDQWHHIAVTRDSSNNLRFFSDGSLVTTVTNTTTFKFRETRLGKRDGGTGTSCFTGEMRDTRVVIGSSVYESAFTPPTEPLTAITNTYLLVGDLPYIKDESTNNFSIHAGTFNNGNNVRLPSKSPISLFDNDPYSEASHGASAYFDGTGDYLSVSNFVDLGTDSWTIEGWYKFDNIIYNSTISQGMFTFGRDNGSLTAMIYEVSGAYKVRVADNGVAVLVDSSTPIQLGKIWNHIAITFTDSDNTIRIFINGNLDSSTGTKSSAWTFTETTFQLGARYYSGAVQIPMEGSIQDFSVTKGVVRYTANFTPPTSPVVADSDTKFLLNPETSISDLSQKSHIACSGDAATDATVVKFSGTKSIALDGTGDYLQTTLSEEIRTSQFTVEGWVRMSTVGGPEGVFGLGASALPGNVDGLGIYTRSSTYSYNWGFFCNGASVNSSTAPSAGVWYHLALVRDSNNLVTMYLDGNSLVTSTQSGSISGDILTIGGYYNSSYTWNGNIQDFRITKGLARYTSNFTPPTAELEG